MKLNSHNTQDMIDEELRQAGDGAPGPEVYESILRDVVDRAGADPKLSYAAGLQRIESIRNRQRRRRNSALIGMSCAAVAACFGLYFMPYSPVDIYPSASGEEMVLIEDGAPPLAALPEGIGEAAPGGIQVEFVDLDEGRLTLRLIGYPDNISWQTAYGVDADGVMYFPIRIDTRQGLITFDSPGADLAVHVSDVDGKALQ